MHTQLQYNIMIHDGLTFGRFHSCARTYCNNDLVKSD